MPEMTIDVPKKELLKILTENRAKHEETYKKAIPAYVKEVQEATEKALAAVEKDPTKDINISVRAPMKFIADYDRAIEMLKMAQNDSITLTVSDFQHFVQDEWKWSHLYLSNTVSKLGI